MPDHGTGAEAESEKQVSTAEYERLGEVRDVLEEIRDCLAGISFLLALAVLTASAVYLARTGALGRLADV